MNKKEIAERILQNIDDNWFQFLIVISLIGYLFFKADANTSSNIISAFIGCISGVKINQSMNNKDK